MTKAEMIDKYGIEYYESFKAKCRKQQYERYHKDPIKARENARHRYVACAEAAKKYRKSMAQVYRINARDKNRLTLMGINTDGLEVHHLKYHKDRKDPDWLRDIVLLSKAEHRQWHKDHPEFKAINNIV
jgi:hypothetical protein